MYRSIAVLLVFSSQLHAAVYKCERNGKTEYSQSPCGQDAQRIELKVQEPSAGDAQKIKDELQKSREKAQSDFDKSQLAIGVSARRARIATLQNSMEIELDRLRQTMAHANNNLAGATYRQSIASEMEAVTQKYRVQIDSLQREIDSIEKRMEEMNKPQGGP
jgi:hypothetical protein